MKLSLKFLSLPAALVLLVMLLVACGAQSPAETAAEPTPESTANGQAAPTPEQPKELETRVFKDYAGREVTIPLHPKRIIVNQFMGHLLAVGMKPVGATKPQLTQFEDSSFLKPLGLTEGVEDLGDTISLEKTLTLSPDLIIVQQNNADDNKNVEELSKIAPTVVLSYGSKTMFDQLKEIADIAGVPEKAEQWIAQYESKAEQYRKQLADVIGPDVTFTVMEAWPKSEIMIFGNLFGRGTFSLYNSLQLKAPPKVHEAVIDKEPSYLKVSLETLPDYIGDYVFLTVYDWQDGDNSKLEEELKNAPVWRSLPVVKEDRVIKVDVKSFLPGDPLSIEKQMEEQTRLLLEKFKK
ncbi:ABC transporter substrate-binding protein [Paenibacillus eucommiae]|uniref:Iron complex transport system substrate-binding protein n=1 Tax=Paenibacillus eucommiae TaxID=1355755 RepID=A0ABS4IYC1_9BACL|nr:ABC transporter substrate-binding protein [Paenibacillus eucommiae]MBP1992065.1 iron complex transport system substrate-binding protein [Paenibacillus eucommiae]